jgi:1,4-alpha-glucan branching enzyme
MKLRFIHIILLMFVVLSGTAQKPHYECTDSQLILRVYRTWSKAETDSILRANDIAHLSTDTLFNQQSVGRLAQEGWSIYKVKKNYTDIALDLTKSDMMAFEQPFILEHQDSAQSLNSYTDQVFGFNKVKSTIFKEIDEKTTRFFFKGNGKEKSVLISGSFNQWSTTGWPLQKNDEGWYIDLQLAPGRYEYKYIVDGKWIQDRENLLEMDDNYGAENSVYFKPNYYFILDHPTAKQVIVSGNFNGWDKNMYMVKMGNLWKLPVFFPDGEYEYKFIVDGQWITDPKNPEQRPNTENSFNSVLVFGTREKITFHLEGNVNAKNVILTGTFNNWDEHELLMKRTDSGWQLEVPLRQSVYRYKFIVDGKWTLAKDQPTCPSDLSGETDHWVVVSPNYTFMLAGYPGAKKVVVAGSFNGWNETDFTMSYRDGVWQLPYVLADGKTIYKFIVDGEWVLDPGNRYYEQNEFGTYNSVLWMNKKLYNIN